MDGQSSDRGSAVPLCLDPIVVFASDHDLQKTASAFPLARWWKTAYSVRLKVKSSLRDGFFSDSNESQSMCCLNDPFAQGLISEICAS